MPRSDTAHEFWHATGYIGQQSGSIGIGFAIPAGTAITIAIAIANQILAR